MSDHALALFSQNAVRVTTTVRPERRLQFALQRLLLDRGDRTGQRRLCHHLPPLLAVWSSVTRWRGARAAI